MHLPFDDTFKEIADNMGISLYQRFTLQEASLFLRVGITQLRTIIKQGKLNYIELSSNNIEFFGYQLLEFLMVNTTTNKTQAVNFAPTPDRIVRAKEVQNLTGLSRTTLWRLEQKEKFPKRVSLGGQSVGWKLSEVQDWIDEK
jgi:predicted DNA-binding transcriptional regulator AlpA